MNELFAEARAKGLWFFWAETGHWFSPDELVAWYTSGGKWRGNPRDWALRDPAEHLAELDKAMVSAEQRRDEFFIRMERSKP